MSYSTQKIDEVVFRDLKTILKLKPIQKILGEKIIFYIAFWALRKMHETMDWINWKMTSE